MKPPKEDIISKVVREWTRKADQDLRAAEALLEVDPPIYSSIMLSLAAGGREVSQGIPHS